MMKKIYVLVIVSILLLSACNKPDSKQKTVKAADKSVTTQPVKNKTSKQKPKQPKQETDKHLDDIVNYFKSKGFKVGPKENVMFAVVGAYNGFRISLNGTKIELYKYTTKNKYFDDAKNKGVIGLYKHKVPAAVNSNFMLVFYDKNSPNKDEIIQTFKDFK